MLVLQFALAIRAVAVPIGMSSTPVFAGQHVALAIGNASYAHAPALPTCYLHSGPSNSGKLSVTFSATNPGSKT